MADGYDATSTITIEAPREEVWRVLLDPAAVKEYMFGTDLETSWAVGGQIRWRGVWKDKPFEDHGVILEVDAPARLVFTHFSPLSGDEDVPENHHTLTWTLDDTGPATTVLTLRQSNNTTPEAAEHSRRMWDQLVATVKQIAERG
ncbi:ATPase [Microbacterium protaetiae]|uniref:ATPase n=1 Tax=Microbacterium protaetiae TaxID=2509458 RepID=A0A4P6EBQ0_9MICO|nr:SRPBCC family protein [Microbacterium protaetiae]QAY59630.1 ATPase [Microbacterium protaetiae]